jgi:hypothetical protein
MPQRSETNALSDLDKVTAITEVPAREAAKVLQTEQPKPTEPPVQAAPKAKAGQGAYPWENIEDKGVVSFNFKLPNKLAAKLKFLGETTYGESMTSIVTQSVERRVAKMLKERGID